MNSIIKIKELLKMNTPKEMYESMMRLDSDSQKMLIRLEHCMIQMEKNKLGFLTDQLYQDDRQFFAQFDGEDILNFHDFLNTLRNLVIKREERKNRKF